MHLRPKPLCYIPTSGNLFPIVATAAARFLASEVSSQNINVDRFMWRVLESLANGGAGITDETCASAALSEYGIVAIPPTKFDKDGFAPGIERNRTIRVTYACMPSKKKARYADWRWDNKASQRLTTRLSRKRLPSVGVLKES